MNSPLERSLATDWRKYRSWPVRRDQPEPSNDKMTTAELLGGYRELVLGLGGNPDALLRQAGMEPSLLDEPEGKVPLRAIGELLEDTAEIFSCPDLGMRLAERQSGPSIMRPLDRLLCNAPTVGEALHCCINHVEAFNSGLLISLDRDVERPLHALRFEFLDGLTLFPQLTEQLLLLAHNSVISLSAGFARSRMVWFSHLNLSRPAIYAKRFGAIVKFGQECDGIFFSEADIKTEIADSDADVFVSECRLIASRYPARPISIDLQVRQLVCRTLARSACTRQNIAAMLGLQERTLNRRLAKLGSSFEAIRDEVRRNLAFRFLARGDLPLTEISARLGYSELAVLSRSCQRWFGAPPNEMRRNLAAARLPRPRLHGHRLTRR